ncbi:MAG TPA: BON domain-containing protein, partial [Erythrobacter sp.]
TEAERQQQGHRRIENGTSCFLAGECDLPSAYAYDRDIATELLGSIASAADLSGTALWVTVQGRNVFIEGCAFDAGSVTAVERLAQRVRFVRHVSVSVRTSPDAPVPYRLMDPK